MMMESMKIWVIISITGDYGKKNELS